MTKFISALQSSVPVLFGMMLLGRRAAPEKNHNSATGEPPPKMDRRYLGEIIVMSSTKIGKAENWEYQ
jgi:hypothetical protein